MIDLSENIETKPSVQVGNTVKWVNDEIDLPFSLKCGKGIKPWTFFGRRSIRGLRLQVSDGHHRSAALGEILIQDHQGNLYHHVDLKGSGFVGLTIDSSEIKVANPSPRRIGGDTWGTWRLDKAERERNIIEDLINAGVRTYRIAAIIELSEIALPDGTKLAVQEAKNKGFINPSETPVVGLRIYRMRERIGHNEKHSKEYFEKAKKIVEQELGEDLSWTQYAQWFARTLGENFAKIHKAGYWHGFPSAHNITLACEIIDFGFGEGDKRLTTLPHSEAEYKRQIDVDEAKVVALMSFCHGLKELGLINLTYEELYKLFDEEYVKIFHRQTTAN